MIDPLCDPFDQIRHSLWWWSVEKPDPAKRLQAERALHHNLTMLIRRLLSANIKVRHD